MKLLNKKLIEELWEEFADVGVTHFDEIDNDFCGWEARVADRGEIWAWFDKQYAEWGGLGALMYPDERKYLIEEEVTDSIEKAIIDSFVTLCHEYMDGQLNGSKVTKLTTIEVSHKICDELQADGTIGTLRDKIISKFAEHGLTLTHY